MECLKKMAFEIIGVSPDDIAALKKFEIKYKLPFPLIADTSHTILEKYGVWDQKKLFGREYMGVLRTTFIIDEKGIIKKIFFKPRNKAHAEEIIEAWKSVSHDLMEGDTHSTRTEMNGICPCAQSLLLTFSFKATLFFVLSFSEQMKIICERLAACFY